ncbi:hypothetical protein SELMODRAFT_408232 [Selaginella moellendorffii]|uniref:Uncharacterized protein n=1 Tax=Selaginella moellendorffii TaxID=88036 RepID=D8R7M2_SELML|nr:hypothetical protein SELMODRAFT_408232 [Selaginella moellendorffii]
MRVGSRRDVGDLLPGGVSQRRGGRLEHHTAGCCDQDTDIGPGYCSTTTCICRDKLFGGAGAYGKHVSGQAELSETMALAVLGSRWMGADWPMEPIVSLATARIMRKWDDEGRSRELYIPLEKAMKNATACNCGDEHFITDDKGVVRVHNRVKCRQSDSAIADLARESPPFSGVATTECFLTLDIKQAVRSNMGGRGRP